MNRSTAMGRLVAVKCRKPLYLGRFRFPTIEGDILGRVRENFCAPDRKFRENNPGTMSFGRVATTRPGNQFVR